MSTKALDLPRARGYRALLPFLYKYYVEIILLVLSLINFGFFILGTMKMQKAGGLGAYIARLDSGVGKIRRNGNAGFETATVGTQFLHRDAIWVGKKEKAFVNLDERGRIEIDESSLIIFKKPFIHYSTLGVVEKNPMSQEALGKEVPFFRIVRGSIKFKDGSVEGPLDMMEKTKNSDHFSEIPRVTDAKNGSNLSQVALNPKPNSIHYLKDMTNNAFTFSWAKAEVGFLVLHNVTRGSTEYIPIENQLSVSLQTLENNCVYSWQIINETKEAVVGPFKFEVRLMDPNSARQLLKSGSPNKVEFHL